MPIDPLLARLRSDLTWPTPIGDRPEPAPGQIWSLDWGGVRAIGLLSHVDRRTVTITLLSVTDAGDDNTVELHAVDAGMSFSAWLSIRATVRYFVLDHRIGTLDVNTFAGLGDLPRPWAPITSTLDDRSLARAELEDVRDALGLAEWAPSKASDRPSLAERVSSAGLDIAQVRVKLGVSAGAARRILQGQREPTVEQAQTLAALLGTTLEDVHGVLVIKEGLLDAMDRPRVRPALRLVADKRFGGDEVAARREFAARTMAMAARHETTGETNWEALLNDALSDD